MSSGIIIAGTHSGVGKTTVSMGIMAALSEKMIVQPYKVGPDYIDPAYHTFITKRKSRNLDSWMIKDKYIKYLYNKNSIDCDFTVVEGVMGLYDGAEIGSDVGSTAKIAKILKLPLVLVVDGGGVSQSIAAVVKGYKEFDNEVNIKGVIFNNVSGEMHYSLLKKSVEMYTGLKSFGYLKKDSDIKLPERHLGLVPSCEQSELSEVFSKLSVLVKETIELEELIKLGKEHNVNIIKSTEIIINKTQKLRIGIAYDEAFNFYYHDNIDLLEEMGVEIVKFSPMFDEKLPDNIDGLIFGGGFPEVFSKELEENYSIRKDIKLKLAEGMPYIAECGGLMYLCKSISDFDNNEFNMVGWFDGKAYMTKKLQRFGYAELELMKNCIYGSQNNKIKVHEFHRSKVEMIENNKIYKLRKIRSNKIIKEWTCGYAKGNGVGAYAHLHYYSNLNFPKALVKTMEKFKKDKL